MSHDHNQLQNQVSPESSHALSTSAFDEGGTGQFMTAPPFQLRSGTGDAPPAQLKSSGGGLGSDLVNGFAANTGHDLSDVKVHRNSDKPSQVGALAYAQGNDIHLGPGQDKHLPHEAAHIVQQREGRVQPTTSVNGMAVNDDHGLESEADKMGESAMQMKSAPGTQNLNKGNGGGSAPVQRKAISPVMQLFTEVEVASQTSGEWNAGLDLRVADNGRVVTSKNHADKACYADPDLIAQSNRELAARNSGIVLEEQSASLRGSAPDGSGRRNLKKVMPTIAHSNNGSSGTGQSSWTDCGRMSREVMGGSGRDEAPHGILETPGGDLQETAPSYQPSQQRDNVLVAAGLGATPAAALAAYRALSPADRDAFDREHGLNRYAAPTVGEAFSVENASGFNFHWGGVIFTPGGGDRVTLENFAKGGGYDSQDLAWYFEMYGPPSKAGQTWHDQWNDPARETFTTRTSTRSLRGTTNAAGVRLVDNPSNWNDPAHYQLLTNGTGVQKIDTDESRWIQVRVLDGPQSGNTGYIMSHYFTGA